MTRQKTPVVEEVTAVDTTPALKSAVGPQSPSVGRYLGVVVISLLAEAATNFTASFVTPGDLAAISKHVDNPYETVALIAWKSTLLAIMWFGGFDGKHALGLKSTYCVYHEANRTAAIDVASLNTLFQTPIFVLHYYFYAISPVSLIATSTATILSSALPFYLLRPLSAPHSTPALGNVKQRTYTGLHLRNRIIISDTTTTLALVLLAAIVFASTLQFCLLRFLPRFFILHFAGLRDLSWAYTVAETWPRLLVWLLPAGLASVQFLFRPSEGAVPQTPTLAPEASGANSVPLHRYPSGHFDPVTAGFWQHVYHNVWGWYGTRQRELIGRTITLGFLLVAETTVSIFCSMAGVEWIGAAGYAGVWYAGVVLLGTMLYWIGAPSD